MIPLGCLTLWGGECGHLHNYFLVEVSCPVQSFPVGQVSLLSCIPGIQLHPGMASRALHPDRFASPLEAGDPAAKVYPCMVAVMADHKAAGGLHA